MQVDVATIDPAPVRSAVEKHHDRRLDLDVIRGVAILLAMGWHFNHVTTGNVVADAILAPGATFGWAGVDLFFVLSGFLIGGAIFHEELRTGGFDYPRFFVRRVFRLWPALYIFLIATLFLGGRPWQTFLWQIGLHVSNYFHPSQATHLWSLAVEEHFYLIAGLGITALMALKGRLRNMWWVLLVIMIASPIVRACGVMLGVDAEDLQQQTHFRMDALAGGVLLANLSVYHQAIFDRLLSIRWAWAPVVAIGVVFLWFVSKASPLGEIAGFSVSYLTGMALLLLVYKSGFERFGAPFWSVIGFLGVVSYSAYLWHVPVSKTLPGLLKHLHLGNSPIIGLAAEYFATFVVAYIGRQAIELPGIKARSWLFPAKGEAV